MADAPAVTDGKVWYTSKTMIFGILTGVLGAIAIAVPQAKALNDFLSANAATIGMVWGVLAIILRAVTKDKVVLSD